MNYETVTLKTDRLIIKRGNKEDFLKVYEYDFKKLKNIDGMFLYIKQDLKEFDKLFKGGTEKYYNKLKKAHMYDWIIYFKDDAVGNILSIQLNEAAVELKCNLHPLYWNNGYMTEALKAVIDYLFYIGYNQIVFGYEDGNIKAKKLNDKFGFKPYSIVKDGFTTYNNKKVDIYKTILEKKI